MDMAWPGHPRSILVPREAPSSSVRLRSAWRVASFFRSSFCLEGDIRLLAGCNSIDTPSYTSVGCCRGIE